MTFVSFWLTSLSIIISRSNLFAPNGIISLFFMTDIPFIHTHTHHIVFILSSDVHLGCFCVLVIINRAATNTEMHVIFSNYCFVKNGILFCYEKGWRPDPGYSIGETWKHCAYLKEANHKRSHHILYPFIGNATGKSMETKHRLMVAGFGEREWGVIHG